MNKIVKNAFLFLLVFSAFVFGSALGAKYALNREMQIHEELLIQNLATLADCKKQDCDEKMQKILIQQNDSAISKYEQVESESKNAFFIMFGQGVWALIYSIYAFDDNASSNKLRDYYSKIGCGLNNVICHPNH